MIGRIEDALIWWYGPMDGWPTRWFLRWLTLRALPREWRCKLRGGHIYERFYGDRYPPREGEYNGYQCARCFHTLHVYSDGKD